MNSFIMINLEKKILRTNYISLGRTSVDLD